MTQGADPSVLVAAVGLRHGARRYPRHAPAGDRGADLGRQGARGSCSEIGAALGKRGTGTRSPARACRGDRHQGAFVRAHIRYAGTDTALVVPDRHRRQRCTAPIAFEKRAQSALRLHRPRKQMVVEAVSVEAVGGGAKFSEKTMTTQRAPSCRRRRARTQFFSGGEWHEAQCLPARSAHARTQASAAPPSSSSRTRPSWSSPAGRPRSPPRIISC